MIAAVDRQGLLRDISEVFAREKINVVGGNTISRRNVASLRFTIEISSTAQLQRTAALLNEIEGVIRAGRKG